MVLSYYYSIVPILVFVILVFFLSSISLLIICSYLSESDQFFCLFLPFINLLIFNVKISAFHVICPICLNHLFCCKLYTFQEMII